MYNEFWTDKNNCKNHIFISHRNNDRREVKHNDISIGTLHVPDRDGSCSFLPIGKWAAFGKWTAPYKYENIDEFIDNLKTQINYEGHEELTRIYEEAQISESERKVSIRYVDKYIYNILYNDAYIGCLKVTNDLCVFNSTYDVLDNIPNKYNNIHDVSINLGKNIHKLFKEKNIEFIRFSNGYNVFILGNLCGTITYSKSSWLLTKGDSTKTFTTLGNAQLEVLRWEKAKYIILRYVHFFESEEEAIEVAKNDIDLGGERYVAKVVKKVEARPIDRPFEVTVESYPS